LETETIFFDAITVDTELKNNVPSIALLKVKAEYQTLASKTIS